MFQNVIPTWVNSLDRNYFSHIKVRPRQWKRTFPEECLSPRSPEDPWEVPEKPQTVRLSGPPSLGNDKIYSELRVVGRVPTACHLRGVSKLLLSFQE